MEYLIIHLAVCLSLSISTANARRFVPFLENEIELIHERHTYSDFRYETANTKVGTDWDELPEDKKATLREAHEIKDCAIHLKLKLVDYKKKRTLCLYRDTSWARTLNSTIEIQGKSYSRKDFIEQVHPVKGFVVHEMNSLVKGYLIDGYFYGTVRIYEAYNAYHIHFYIEPVESLPNYSTHPLNLRGNDHNALIFEYVGHDTEVGVLRPPEDIAKEQYEMQRNETGGAILTEFGGLSYTINQNKTRPKREAEHGANHSNPATHQRHLTPGAKRRKEAAEALIETTPDNIIVAFHDDVAGITPLQGGVSTSDIFDTSSGMSTLCTLCVWIEPLFAEMYGLGNGGEYGVGEIIEMLRRLDWLFRAMDFNVDNVAENFGFIIKTVTSTNEFNVQLAHNKTRRRRDADQTQTQTNDPPSTSEVPATVVSSTTTGVPLPESSSTTTVVPLPDSSTTTTGVPVTDISTTTTGIPANHIHKKTSHGKKQASPKGIYRSLVHQLKKNVKFSNCCAMVAFAYLDLTPVLSVATIRGLCSKDNLVLVGGVLHGHKLGIYDIQRALLHAFGHMMGSEHDKTMRAKCQDKKPSKYYNPFVMHPVQQGNVGLRTNSFRMSSCSKLEITAFLNSNNLNKCLLKDIDDYCGNGMLDPGEECDCGSAWQCHLQECCGESDTIFRCRVTRLGRRQACDRPQKW